MLWTLLKLSSVATLSIVIFGYVTVIMCSRHPGKMNGPNKNDVIVSGAAALGVMVIGSYLVI